MNIKKSVLALFLMFVGFGLQGQSTAIYGEALGNGLFYSVNLDRSFSQGPGGVGIRAGVGFIKDEYNIPLHVNYVFGGRHGLEVAAGITMHVEKGVDGQKVAPSSSLMYRYTGYNGLFFRAGITQTYLKEDPQSPSHIPLQWFLFYPGLSLGYTF